VDRGEERLAPGGPAEAEQRPGAADACGTRPEVLLTLIDLAAAKGRIPSLIEALEIAGQTMLDSVRDQSLAKVGEVMAWTQAEHGAMFDLFVEYMQSLQGGDINSDALGLIAVATLLFPPTAAANVALSIVGTAAGFAANSYNRELQSWRDAVAWREIDHLGKRMVAVDDATRPAQESIVQGLYTGGLALADVAVQRGALSELLVGMGDLSAELRGECSRSGGGVDSVMRLARSSLVRLRSTEPQAWANVRAMQALPGAIGSELAAGTSKMKAEYVKFLAQQGPIRVNGSLMYDGQSGGDYLQVSLDSVSSIGTMVSSGLGPETQQMLIGRPGYMIGEAGASYDLTLKSTIHTYEQLPGANEGERGPPETLSDTMFIHVGGDDTLSSHAYSSRFPLRRVGDELRSRR